jgi:hypothetical protein
MSHPLVAVIVPAYNSEATLDETLRSVRSQTHRALEVLVVDDGSTDGTAAVAERHVGEDHRVRLIRQPNGGVAKARNRAIAEAKADLIAPVDADDLWHPEKIERQLAALDSHPNVGLVYTWFAKIDQLGRIIELEQRAVSEGNVLAALCVTNVVGHASSPLMLRAAIEKAGGYDESLRARGAQGCEDNELYLAIASDYDFALVREFLVGYRDMPQGMSSDYRQMLRSRDLSVQPTLRRHPELAGQLQVGRTKMLKWMISRAMSANDRRSVQSLLLEMMRTAPGAAMGYVARFATKRLPGRRSHPSDPRIGLPYLEAPNLVGPSIGTRRSQHASSPPNSMNQGHV